MIFATWVIGVLALDQITKALAVYFLASGAPVVVIPGLFSLVLRHNSGAAFSLFSEHPGILTAINCLLSAGIVFMGLRTPARDRLRIAALGLVAGGAMGNLADRFFRGFTVVDFLDMHWFYKAHWPTFNIADAAICIGIGLLFLEAYMLGKREKLAAAKKRMECKKATGQTTTRRT